MRQLLFLCVLLLGVAWAAAQTSYPSHPSSGQAETHQTSTGSHTSVEGCLSSSGGKYMLTDQQGKAFELMGDTSKLAEHIGHEVMITGTESKGSASSAGHTMANESAQSTIEVTSVRDISKTCKSGGMAK